MKNTQETDKKPIPTIGLEAQLIRKRLETAEVGELIEYSELEKIAGRGINDLRGSFYTAARQIFRDCGWTFGAVTGVGYKRLDASEKLDSVEVKRRHIHRTAKRSGAVLASIEVAQLPQEDQVRHNLETSFAGALALATSRKAAKQIGEQVEAAPLPSKDVLALFTKD